MNLLISLAAVTKSRNSATYERKWLASWKLARLGLIEFDAPAIRRFDHSNVGPARRVPEAWHTAPRCACGVWFSCAVADTPVNTDDTLASCSTRGSPDDLLLCEFRLLHHFSLPPRRPGEATLPLILTSSYFPEEHFRNLFSKGPHVRRSGDK